jgi:predicted nucleotidyltransferase
MQYSLSEIKNRLSPVFKNSPVDRAVLFGSYAKGDATPSSDIDLLIDSNGKIKGIDFFGILEEMTEALKKPVDLLEASQIIKDGRIHREIEQTGVVIYERTR